MGDVLFPCVVQKVAGPLILDPIFANNTWVDIVRACRRNKVPDSWAVGAQKAMTINGTEYLVDIIGKYHDDYADGSGKAPLTFQLHDCYGTKYKLNLTESNTGGWASCLFRMANIPDIIAVMPDVVRAGLREVTKTTGIGNTRQTVSATADKLFLLSQIEIFNVNNATTEGEGSQYAYYAAGGSTIKTYNGVAADWWERSPYLYTADSFGCVKENGTHGNNGPSGVARCVSFAFCF